MQSQQLLIQKTVKESTADLFAQPLHGDPGIQRRRRSNPPFRLTYFLYRKQVRLLKRFHRRSILGKTTCQTKKSSREPFCTALSTSCFVCSCAGLAKSQGRQRAAMDERCRAEAKRASRLSFLLLPSFRLSQVIDKGPYV